MPAMTLSKMLPAIPARRKTLIAEWCHRDFTAMSPQYRKIRAKCRKAMNKCHWCKHPFEDGEMMALACFEGIGNHTLCHSCADELMGVGEEPTE